MQVLSMTLYKFSRKILSLRISRWESSNNGEISGSTRKKVKGLSLPFWNKNLRVTRVLRQQGGQNIRISPRASLIPWSFLSSPTRVIQDVPLLFLPTSVSLESNLVATCPRVKYLVVPPSTSSWMKPHPHDHWMFTIDVLPIFHACGNKEVHTSLILEDFPAEWEYRWKWASVQTIENQV